MIDTATMARTALLLTCVSLCGCTYRPTQVTLLMDTNVADERPQRLTIASRYGARSADEMRAALRSETALSNGTSALFPGSVALIPKTGGERSGTLTMLAVLDVAATAEQPALRIERLQTLNLIERTPQQARIVFNAQCNATAVGCESASGAACTVSLRCIELGQTCGDEGVCVPTVLPMVVVPEGTPLDATIIEASARDATAERPADVATPSGPLRLIAPLSTSMVTSRRPTLRWLAPSAGASVEVRLCRDRAMSAGCVERIVATTDRARPTSELAAGVWFWRAQATSGGPISTPVWQFRVGSRSADADRDTRWGVGGDFDGDGFADVAVGAPSSRDPGASVRIFRGSPTGVAAAASTVLAAPADSAQFGYLVASAGDVDGDGFGDLLVAAKRSPTRAGSVEVYLGSATGLRSTAARSIGALDDTFDLALAGLGDVNGDGFGDVAIGAQHATANGLTQAGTVGVYLGSSAGLASTPSVTLAGSAQAELFGNAVAGAGDVDGDGFADVVVGAFSARSGSDATGRVSVFHGAASGLRSSASRVIDGGAGRQGFGQSVAGVGDLNGDGYADIAACRDTFVDMVADNVLVFLGSATGIGATPARIYQSAVVDDGFGYSIAGAGDVNGDGFGDLLIGAHNASPGGRMRAGTAQLFLGSAAGPSMSALVTFEGVGAVDQFGLSVASAGDVNGDGFADVIVGAPLADPAMQTGVGAASVFHGSATGPTARVTRELAGPYLRSEFGTFVAGSW